MKAGELCIRQVVTAHPGESVSDAARRMAEYEVGDVVIVEELGGEVRPVGMLTDRDLVTRAVARPGVRLDELRLADVMRVDLIVAHEEDDVDAVLAKLARHTIRRIPVVDGKGRLQGILSLDDVLGWIASQLDRATELLDRQGRSAVPVGIGAVGPAGIPSRRTGNGARRRSLRGPLIAVVATGVVVAALERSTRLARRAT